MYFKLYFPALFLTLSTGCSTITSIVSGELEEPTGCYSCCTVTRVYSGTSYDIASLRALNMDQGLIILDLPFSFVADTVVLPYTVYKQIRFGNLCDAKEEYEELDNDF